MYVLSPFQLKLEGSVAFVEIFLKLSGGKSVDLTEEVYSADVSVFQSMDFGPSQTMDAPSATLPLPLPLSTAGDSKPSEKASLDALPSPLTLPNSNSVSMLGVFFIFYNNCTCTCNTKPVHINILSSYVPLFRRHYSCC